ncbi:unnamed protein product [Polarella glacialis]|uniref:Uncharacterized protein n=1 Tax=Polarella glacialis TaxID=89957 RepID=A0A813HB02_POLGL|nr:unnamed protein product [Polarella glacialis]
MHLSRKSAGKARVAHSMPLPLRMVPLTFLLYQFSLLLFVACFTAAFVVGNDCEKRNMIGNDRKEEKRTESRSAPAACRLQRKEECISIVFIYLALPRKRNASEARVSSSILPSFCK